MKTTPIFQMKFHPELMEMKNNIEQLKYEYQLEDMKKCIEYCIKTFENIQFMMSTIGILNNLIVDENEFFELDKSFEEENDESLFPKDETQSQYDSSSSSSTFQRHSSHSPLPNGQKREKTPNSSKMMKNGKENESLEHVVSSSISLLRQNLNIISPEQFLKDILDVIPGKIPREIIYNSQYDEFSNDCVHAKSQNRSNLLYIIELL